MKRVVFFPLLVLGARSSHEAARDDDRWLRTCGQFPAQLWRRNLLVVSLSLAVGTLCGCVEPATSGLPVSISEESARRLDELLTSLDASGSQAQQRYEKSLATLSARPDAISLLIKSTEVAPPRSMRRWKLVYLLSQLPDVRSLPTLLNIASQPPLKSATEKHHAQHDPVDPNTEQLVVQYRAIGAIEEIAKTSGAGVNALRKLIAAPQRQVGMAASVALHRLGALTTADLTSMKNQGFTAKFRTRSKREGRES